MLLNSTYSCAKVELAKVSSPVAAMMMAARITLSASPLALASTLSLSRTGCAAAARRRFWKPVVIERLVTDAVPVLIEPANRLLEEARLRIAGGHRAFEDVQLVLVHVDGGRGARLVRVVRHVDHRAFDQVDVVPAEVCDFGVALHELPLRVGRRAGEGRFPISEARRTPAAPARFSAGWARLGALGRNRLDVVVVGDRHLEVTVARI